MMTDMYMLKSPDGIGFNMSHTYSVMKRKESVPGLPCPRSGS